MDSLTAIFLSSFLLALSGAMMPGPLLTATIGESASRGPSTGPLLILGHGILEVALLLLLFLGLSPFFQSRWVFIAIALAGSWPISLGTALCPWPWARAATCFPIASTAG